MKGGEVRRLLALGAAAMLLPLGCFNDYDKFEIGPPSEQGGEPGGAAPVSGAGSGGIAGVAGEPSGGTAISSGGAGGAGGASGAAGSAGSSGATSGASGASGAGGGALICEANQKPCDDVCVPNDDPSTGCAEASCAACPTAASGTVGCDAGFCKIVSCEPGQYDCNETIDDGCEHGASTFDDANCGGCGNDCAAQGFQAPFSCEAGVCACSANLACGDRPAHVCNPSGRCACGDPLVECQPGEACRKEGNRDLCSCNGGTEACAAGQVCCHTPPGCFDLQSNVQNCGACGWACTEGMTCVAGVCTPPG